MLENNYILSLCIPTNGVVEWVMPVLRNIYTQGGDRSKFEVVVADNGSTDDLGEAIKEINEPNLLYFKSTEKGFVNQIACFKAAHGEFIKMLNHRSIIKPGIIELWINLVEHRLEEKPIIYCLNGTSKGHEIQSYPSLDGFVKECSIYTTWSGGFGIWKEDLPMIDNIQLNRMFPTTSLLFEIRPNARHELWNRTFENQISDAGKGGYNLFHTFGVVYPDMLKDLLNRKLISNDTFKVCLKDLYYFLCGQYYDKVIANPSKFTFDLSGIRKNMKVYFGNWLYFRMLLGAWKNRIVDILKR